MSVHEAPSTAPGRAYRWWGIGAITCIVLAGIGVLCGVPLAVLGDRGWPQTTGTALVFVLIPVGILGAIYCGHKRYRASFTNAHVSEGLIEDVTEVRDSEDNSFYFMLTVSATVAGGPIIRRHCTMGGNHPRPGVGQTLRFRHTTLDPENLDDAVFEGIREHQ
ncbi:ABC transporter permease [Mycolicibacterium sp. 050232]|uniref:ABC transporter permease n=1 Tax=Mycolicibacterium sp. 050232 TaxID=3113982 RepID=UPI002E2D4AE9|nr:ABC transporter permease [Mycolicibacterium sp. 050232]MED5814475.1 ABC transporter permease [Mycolicibacterium sp. 050232]